MSGPNELESTESDRNELDRNELDRNELDRILLSFSTLPSTRTQPLSALRSGIDKFARAFPIDPEVTLTQATLAGRPVEWLVARSDGPVMLYLHGGGYVIGSPRSHRHLSARLAQCMLGQVATLDYRLAPEAPWPAAVDDAVAAYRALLETYPSQRIVIAGDSAGGGLAFISLIRALKQGLPMPACLIAFSPWVNQQSDGASFDDPGVNDPLISRQDADFFADHYAPAKLRRHPEVSPLFADLAGLPPCLIQAGEREVFIADIRKFADALHNAGVPVRCEVWPTMFHVWHLYWPMLARARAAIDDVARFVQSHVADAKYDKR